MGDRRSHGAWLRGLLVVVAAIAALGAWALSSPVGSSPDDDFHLASIACAGSASPDLCVADAGRVVVPAYASAVVQCFAFQPAVGGVCQSEAGYPQTVAIDPARSNAGRLYPGGYYWAMGHLATLDMETSAMAMRLVALALAVGVLAGALAFAPPSVRQAGLLGLLVAAGPLGWFIVASNNPSGWAVAGLSALWIGTLGALFSPGPVRVVASATFGLLGGLMAAGSRFDAAAFVVIVGFALFATALLSDRVSRTRVTVLGSLLVIPVAAAFVLRAATGQGALLDSDVLGGGRSGTEQIVWNFLDQPTVVFGSLGFWGLGWLDTPTPPIVHVIALLLVGGLLFAGAKSVPSASWVPWSVVLVALFAVPLYIYWRNGIAVGEFVQPRYLLPLLPLVVGWLLVRRSPNDEVVRFSRAQAGALLIGVWFIYAVSLHVNLRRYVTGLDARLLDLNRGAEWLPMGPLSANGLWLFGVLACAAMLGGLWVYVNPRPTR